MWRRPVLQIINSAGKNILPGLAGIWLECSVTDNAGKESDSAKILCLGPPSRFGLPTRGDRYSILMGWADEGPVLQGIFSVQKIVMMGDPAAGDRISIQLRAADYVDKLKASGREHFDPMTFGALAAKVAKRAGLEASVDADLAKINLPYQLRWDQSPIDFLSEVGGQIGAVVKPAGGKLVALKRGGGKSASGKDLTPIFVRRRGGFGYEIETEPRPEVGNVAASWHDEKSGRRKLVKEATGRDGPIFVLPNIYKTEEAAKTAAKAEAYERGNNSGSGWFESPGLPHAFAEAPVFSSDYGWPIDGRWKAESVEKVITAQGAFKNTVNVKAGDEKKGKKG